MKKLITIAALFVCAISHADAQFGTSTYGGQLSSVQVVNKTANQIGYFNSALTLSGDSFFNRTAIPHVHESTKYTTTIGTGTNFPSFIMKPSGPVFTRLPVVGAATNQLLVDSNGNVGIGAGGACSLCLPTLSGVTQGNFLGDSSGVPIWQAVAPLIGANQIAFGDGAGNLISNAGFTASGGDLHTGGFGNGNGGMVFHNDVGNFYAVRMPAGAVSPVVLNLPVNEGASGNVLTTDGSTNTSWTPVFGTPTLDSIATSGATVSLTVNSTFVITASGTVTAATLSFPTGVTGNWIIVEFNRGITTITNSGTGSGTVNLISVVSPFTKTYFNNGGNWR